MCNPYGPDPELKSRCIFQPEGGNLSGLWCASRVMWPLPAENPESLFPGIFRGKGLAEFCPHLLLPKGLPHQMPKPCEGRRRDPVSSFSSLPARTFTAMTVRIQQRTEGATFFRTFNYGQWLPLFERSNRGAPQIALQA
jgi:hypothetical protein